MGLVNVEAFLLLKILYALVLMNYFLNGDNYWHKQIFDKYPA